MTIPTPGTPIYDPRPFTPEQEARIAQIAARAAEQAVSDMMRKSQRRL